MLFDVKKASVRSLVILILVIGSCFLAIIDKEFRDTSFGNIVTYGLGGYTGQLIPNHR